VADPGVLLTGPVKILAPTDAVRRPTTRHVVLEAEVADPGSAGFTVNVLGVPPLWADVSPGPYSLQSGPFRIAHLEAKESGPPSQKIKGSSMSCFFAVRLLFGWVGFRIPPTTSMRVPVSGPESHHGSHGWATGGCRRRIERRSAPSSLPRP